MNDVVAPFLGFSILVTLGVLAWAVIVYLTTPEGESSRLPKRARWLYHVGAGTIVVCVAIAAGVGCWAFGRFVMGGW